MLCMPTPTVSLAVLGVHASISSLVLIACAWLLPGQMG
eukprot:COSAG01_NODE_2247_length_8072_cov_48.931704_8_plen_38_part_00